MIALIACFVLSCLIGTWPPLAVAAGLGDLFQNRKVVITPGANVTIQGEFYTCASMQTFDGWAASGKTLPLWSDPEFRAAETLVQDCAVPETEQQTEQRLVYFERARAAVQATNEDQSEAQQEFEVARQQAARQEDARRQEQQVALSRCQASSGHKLYTSEKTYLAALDQGRLAQSELNRQRRITAAADGVTDLTAMHFWGAQLVDAQDAEETTSKEILSLGGAPGAQTDDPCHGY